jgi:dihydrofolate reductase
MQPINGLSLIVAMTPNRIIGQNNTIPWRIPSDMQRFKSITDGHPVIMGRNTWESIPEKFRPLPGRTNIVLTHQSKHRFKGAKVADSINDARRAAASAPGANEVFVIGGAEVYKEFLPLVSKMYLTIVQAAIPGGGVRFPHINMRGWKSIEEVRPDFTWQQGDQYKTSYSTLVRTS